MKTIELTLISGPFGDGCSIYSFAPKNGALTFREFVKDVLASQTWGCISVHYQGTDYEWEYEGGRVTSGEYMPLGIFDVAVTGGSAFGGWSRMDYLVGIK